MKPNSQSIKLASFSTNLESFSPISIIRQFFLSTNTCANIKYPKNHLATFDYMLSDSVIRILFEEINMCEKCFEKKADCFVVFVDLEKDDAYSHLDVILSYVNEHCDTDKKFYFLGIYTEIEYIKENLNQQHINDYLKEKNLFYEYMELDINNTKNLIQILESLINKTANYKYSTNEEAELCSNEASSKCQIY